MRSVLRPVVSFRQDGVCLQLEQEVGIGIEPKRAMLCLKTLRRALQKKRQEDEEGGDGLELRSLEARNDRCRGH